MSKEDMKLEVIDITLVQYLAIIFIILFLLIAIGLVIGLRLSKSKYFDDVIKNENSEVRFFIKKHTIFRFFSIFYALLHHFLNIISITASFITVYMVMAPNSVNRQIFFLLTAAITSNLVLGLRIDKISEVYAQAMRILENAILKYSMENGIEVKVLYEANDKAEQLIGNKFF